MRKLRPLLIVLAVAMLAAPVLPALAIQIAQAIPHTVVTDPALVTSHSMALANLTPGTAYTYQIRSCDAAGNCTVSQEQQFTTAQAPPTATVAPTATSTPIPGATFASSATAAPGAVTPGQATTISVAVTSSTTRSLLVDLELYSPGGAQTAQRFFDAQPFVGGQPRTFTWPWTAPAGATPGAYVIKVGLFAPGWGALLNWNDTAGSLVVSAAAATPTSTPVVPPTPTSTPVVPTTTPTVPATATPTMTPTVLPTATPTPTPSFVDVEWDCRITFDLFGVPIRMLCE